MFSKFIRKKSPFYILKLIPEKTSSCDTRKLDGIAPIKIKHKFFEKKCPTCCTYWMEETRYIISFGTLKVLGFLKALLPNSLDSTQEDFLTVTTTKEFVKGW